jgi:hypothetical protein
MKEEKKLFTQGSPIFETSNNKTATADYSYIKNNIYKPNEITPNEFHFNFPCAHGLEIKQSIIDGIGAGVFTTKDINNGDIIERVRTLELANRARYQNDATLNKYMLTDYCTCRECIIHGPTVKVLMGFGSFYNHQEGDTQNCEWMISSKYNFLDIVAIRDIKAGQELFLNYGDNYFSKVKYKKATQQ